MNNTKAEMIMHRWNVIQHELIPAMREQVGTLTPKLERLIHTLEWVRIEEFTKSAWCGIGRPPAERAWLANAFVAKSVLGLGNTRMLIERLQIDRSLRRICGFSMYVTLPSESTFSRAFEEFATSCLAERVHEALIKEHLGEQLIGHISRDGTAIPARERPFKSQARYDRSAPKAKPAKRGRPRRGEVRPPAKESALKIQRNQTLKQMRNDIPQACDRATQVQRPRLQDQLERLQTAHRHRRLRCAHQCAVVKRLGARQPCVHPLGVDEPAAREQSLRRDGCGLLQQRLTRAQQQSGPCSLD